MSSESNPKLPTGNPQLPTYGGKADRIKHVRRPAGATWPTKSTSFGAQSPTAPRRRSMPFPHEAIIAYMRARPHPHLASAATTPCARVAWSSPLSGRRPPAPWTRRATRARTHRCALRGASRNQSSSGPSACVDDQLA
jgi:hypothetical protein